MMDVVVKYWLTWVMGLLAAAMGYAYRKAVKRSRDAGAENTALKAGIKA